MMFSNKLANTNTLVEVIVSVILGKIIVRNYALINLKRQDYYKERLLIVSVALECK